MSESGGGPTTRAPNNPGLNPPGWYNDPAGRFEYRYHNGAVWTSDVASHGQRYVDPMAPGGGPPIPHSRPPDFAAAGETHDERLWMPIAEATGAMGNTSCLVGTPEQVARAVLEYYKLGIHSFLIRGFDPFEDTVDFGRELIPRLRAGAAELDRARAA